jgi:hypothetical protein
VNLGDLGLLLPLLPLFLVPPGLVLAAWLERRRRAARGRRHAADQAGRSPSPG